MWRRRQAGIILLFNLVISLLLDIGGPFSSTFCFYWMLVKPQKTKTPNYWLCVVPGVLTKLDSTTEDQNHISDFLCLTQYNQVYVLLICRLKVEKLRTVPDPLIYHTLALRADQEDGLYRNSSCLETGSTGLLYLKIVEFKRHWTTKGKWHI